MRQIVLSTCELDFIYQSFVADARLDGRECSEYRNFQIKLGNERGSCFVTLGGTKVLAQISSSIIDSKSGRSNEGALYVNVEMSPMAAAHFESGRLGDYGVEICRLIERSLKQSRCLDMESLCIIAGEKVWEIRVDVHIMDNDGSLIDCASIAAICALRHFRRPEVTKVGNRLRVYSQYEKEPLPLNIYHYPLCVTFGFCDRGNIIVADPTDNEEHILEGKVVITMNSHQEVCNMHCSGSSVFQKAQLLACTSRASQRIRFITSEINRTFEEDSRDRTEKKERSYGDIIGVQRITGLSQHVRDTDHELTPTSSYTAEPMEIIPDDEVAPAVTRTGKVAHLVSNRVLLPTENDSDVEVIDETITTTITEEAKPPVITPAVDEVKEKKRRRGKVKADKAAVDLLDELEQDVQLLLPGKGSFVTENVSRTESKLETIDLTDALRKKPTKSKKTNS